VKNFLASARIAAAGVVLALATFACATAPAALYPEITKQKERPLNLWVDVAIAHDVSGNIDQIDIPECNGIGKAVQEEIVRGLTAKGYKIRESAITSMGLAWEGDKYKVVRSDEERAMPVEKIANQPPPFFVAPEFTDPERVSKLTSVYKDLRKVEKKKGEPNAHIDVGKLARPDEAWLIVHVAARDVPLGKQIGQAIFTSLLTLGTVAIWQTSGITLDTYMVDSTTGEVFWADRAFVKGGRASQKSVVRMATQAVNRFP
jgi:hypothetical protein